MPTASSNGIELCYDTFGNPDDPALLLVMGFTAQMIAWDEKFCTMLADHGRYVIRLDNRDCGLSTKLDGVEVDALGVMAAATSTAEEPPPMPEVPYLLSDFSDDSFGLLDHLGVERAHLVGASMGGMIVQTMAIEHPERVLSMTSIMSTTGELEYGQAEPATMAALLTPPPTERDAILDNAVKLSRMLASPRYFDEERIRTRAGAAFDRCFYPEGAPRQLSAVYASGDRAEALRGVTAPTLVIHGRADTLVTPSGGERTAELIPGANLLLVHDMGHDLPVPLWPLLVDVIASHQTHAVG
jgi:pimeloyl-ACP methyl ester carboxylesterase